MMIRNDELHAELVNVFSLVDSGDTVIHGYYHVCALVGYFLYRSLIQTVSLGALGDIVADLSTYLCEV